ncbi:MAG: FAD-dependent oxidoreductase [Nitrososphaera sp.]
MSTFKLAIIGGGLLGISIAYFLSSHTRRPDSVVLLEQESNVAMHTSSRNTGKVHAPFLYDPSTKKTLATAAALGYDMWLEYSNNKHLTFVRDGVLEVATDEKGIDRLRRYMVWGKQNGLLENELVLLDASDVARIEPSVKCSSAIFCSKDGSVDYGAFAHALLADCQNFGCKIMLGARASRIAKSQGSGSHTIVTADGAEIQADFIVNSAGGNAVDIAHAMDIARDYTDLHFRGEYWQAPDKYKDLTRLSIYSVPKHPEYPFLDPHWIVRSDGRREVGPNAVPVFGPYAYGWEKNLADMIPKILESSRTGAKKMVLDRQFLSLASAELKSSLSKTAMVNRVREFLPQLRPADFQTRGTSGIRSSVVDSRGRFVPDTIILERENSLHILNYNSPGATGALPMAARIASTIFEAGVLQRSEDRAGLWDASRLAEQMK